MSELMKKPFTEVSVASSDSVLLESMADIESDNLMSNSSGYLIECVCNHENRNHDLLEGKCDKCQCTAFTLKEPSANLDERESRIIQEIQFREGARLLTDGQRAKYFGLPEGCRIREGAKIYSPEKFKCGEYCWFGEDCKLDASGGLEIGSHTTIGLSVFIWTHASFLTNLTMQNTIGNKLIRRNKTKIGDGVFIGGHAVIYPGVTIGDKCVILPMSVVTKDVPPYSLVAGSPAKVIKTIDEEWIEREVKKCDVGISNHTVSHNRNELCETVMNLNKNITSVAIINKQGRIEASSQRNSDELLSNHTSEMFLMHCVLQISMGRDFDEQYGSINYYISERPNLMILTFPWHDGAVMVSINKNVNPVSIAKKIATILSGMKRLTEDVSLQLVPPRLESLTIQA